MQGGFSRNEVKYYGRCACTCIANTFFAGTLLQTFLAAHGVPVDRIGMLAAALSMVQMVSMLLFSAAVDRLREPLKKSAALLGCMPLYYVVMLLFTFWAEAPAGALFGAVLAAGVVQSVLLGLNGILDYRVPYQIIDMRHYARLNSYQGITSGIAAVCIGSLTTFLLSRFHIDRVMSAMYALSAMCMVGASLCTRAMKPVMLVQEAAEKKDSGLLATLKLPAFRVLFLPNLMRGFNTGVIGMLATIGIHELGIHAAQSSAMGVIATVASIVGAYGFLHLARRFRAHWLYFGASAAMCALLPMLMAGRNFSVFAAVYLVLLLGQSVADNAAPVLVAKIVPYECIGSFTAVRIGLFQGGISLGSIAAGAALGRIPVVWLLLFSGMMQLISGLVYWLFARKQPAVREDGRQYQRN